MLKFYSWVLFIWLWNFVQQHSSRFIEVFSEVSWPNEVSESKGNRVYT